MSLLMDALKKAEEEKKQAAKRLQEVEIEAREIADEPSISNIDSNNEDEETTSLSDPPELFTETAQFSLQPLSLEEKLDEIEELQIDESDSKIEIKPAEVSENFSEDLTLENTIAEGVETQEVFEETQKVVDLNDTTVIEGLSTENASAPFDDTFHGVLFEDEETGADSDVYEETLPGVPADQLVKDLGGGKYQPTPVAAKTVFSAGGKPNKKQTSFKWGVFVVLALLAVCSFSIFYYFTITPVSRTLPSPIIARGIESSGIKPVPITSKPDITELAETKVAIANINETLDTKSNVENIDGVAHSQTIKEEVFEIAEQQEGVDNVAGTNLVVEKQEPFELEENKTNIVLSKNNINTSQVVLEDANQTKNTESTKNQNSDIPTEKVTKVQKIDESLIDISKSKKRQKENILVTEAYKAYKDGHLNAAKSIYEGVLKNDPDNRDAHLGLGAIAISNQDIKSAYKHYVYLVELNPQDTIAMNALIGLSNSVDPVKDESAIKKLISRDGDIPALYFSLGSIYAKQQRWPSAQQAYFDAYRLDSSNPDYVVNLAISLDKMGQYNTALDYYKTAIDLSKTSSVRFDSIQVKNRIFNLSKLVETKQ